MRSSSNRALILEASSEDLNELSLVGQNLARSSGISGGAGRWVSLPSPLSSSLIPRGVLAPIPEAVGAVLFEAIC
jgi:hypothetical protein